MDLLIRFVDDIPLWMYIYAAREDLSPEDVLSAFILSEYTQRASDDKWVSQNGEYHVKYRQAVLEHIGSRIQRAACPASQTFLRAMLFRHRAPQPEMEAHIEMCTRCQDRLRQISFDRFPVEPSS